MLNAGELLPLFGLRSHQNNQIKKWFWVCYISEPPIYTVLYQNIMKSRWIRSPGPYAANKSFVVRSQIYSNYSQNHHGADFTVNYHNFALVNVISEVKESSICEWFNLCCKKNTWYDISWLLVPGVGHISKTLAPLFPKMQPDSALTFMCKVGGVPN